MSLLNQKNLLSLFYHHAFLHRGVELNFFAHAKKKAFSSFHKDSKTFLTIVH